jgi:hypothetical protein
MKSTQQKSKGWLYWTPRILGILAFLFIELFSLDVFGQGSVLEQIIGFVIHSIPALILLAILFVAWKWETIGGILYIIAGFGLMSIYIISGIKEFHWYLIVWAIQICFPIFLTGILFLFHAQKMRKK